MQEPRRYANSKRSSQTLTGVNDNQSRDASSLSALITVPPPHAYYEPINWHRTALHELGHATGHRSRLNRDLSGSFGSRKYAFEELVAEMSAAFCCASLGIVPTVRHADYIGSWLGLLRAENRAIVRAASQASKAADYLLSFRPAANQVDDAAPDPVGQRAA